MTSAYHYLPDVDAKVNGQKATVTREGVTVPAEYIIVRYDFGKCPETINFISLNAPAKPKEGEVIGYNVSSNTEGCHIAGGGSKNTEYCQWLESYGGGDWRVMSPGETFKAGCYYRFQADVVAEGGYVLRSMTTVPPSSPRYRWQPTATGTGRTRPMTRIP